LWWQSWKYAITGFEYWWFNWWEPNIGLSKEEPPWPEGSREEWNSRSFEWANGDGLLVYPGPRGEPLPSIRLSVIRDAIEDWEALFILRRAVELAEQRLAPILFVASGGNRSELELAICEGTDFDFTTACADSDPHNTFGNAVVTADVAAENSWDSLILVTSDDHIARSHMLLDRCYDGEIQTAVSVENEDRDRVGRTIYEWAAVFKAIFTDRC